MADCQISVRRFLQLFYTILVVSILFDGYIVESREPCQEGTFGWRCKFKCYCKNNTSCDPVSGHCYRGCDDSRYGVGCLLKSTCMYDTKGKNYTGVRQYATDGVQCLNWNSKTGLERGYKPYHFPDQTYPKNYCRNPNMKGYSGEPWCLTDTEKGWSSCDIEKCGCQPGRFGDSCLKECHCKDPNEVCNELIGTCIKKGCADGWIDTDCQTPCKGGDYGDYCVQKCGKCAVGTCDHETGVCHSGCAAGWKGPLCKTKCPPEMYGRGCRKKCGRCLLKSDCDRITGRCPHGKCQQGWNGRTCNKPCGNKTWGMGCREICGDCRNGESCAPYDGQCRHGCGPGWSGYKCDKECEPGKHGENCSLPCGYCRHNKPCDRYTGVCLAGCDDGYQGRVCRTAMSKSLEVATIGGIAAVALVVIVILLLIIIFVKRRKSVRKGQYKVERGSGRSLHEPTTKETDNLLTRKDTFEVVEGAEKMDNDVNEMNEGPIYENVDLKKPSQPVNLEDLLQYINSHKENNNIGFKREYEQLPTGLLAIHNVADKEGNKSKNRYGNIVAYDHSRVVLKPLQCDAHSDYVNASFIDGYEQPEAYIASQGPNKAMLNDYWRLVWQRDIYKIVMLTNLVEACKRKCEQYWPELDCIEKYGDIQVTTTEVTVYTDYTVRTFNLIHIPEQCSRVVIQYHFTAWSDHGAPTQPTSVLAFIRKVNQFIPPTTTGPVLTHCSAGIGRTGTYIAINNLLAQAREESRVDVLACVGLMRANRVNMIQNLEQYIFVYDAIYEALTAGDTTISCDNLPAKYAELTDPPPDGGESLLQQQFQILQRLSPTIERYEYKTALTEVNNLKNRFKNILPSNRCRPYLYTVVDGCNDYINSVFVHGFSHRDAYLVTQMPMPNTLPDFWRMMFDYNSCLVIMLNDYERDDATCALYWPEEHGYPVTHGPLSMELLMSSEADADFTVREFKLSHTHKPNEERAIKQIVFQSWSHDQPIPDTAALLRLVDMAAMWRLESPANNGPVTVHCMNGASRSGLFCAASLVYDSVRVDSEVDIFKIVKQIRANRPQFIESLEQYEFLYQFALEVKTV